MTDAKVPLPGRDAVFTALDGSVDAWFARSMHAHATAVSAADNAALRADAIRTQNEVVGPLRERVKVLEDALVEVLTFQSAPTQPTIHDWGRWRRAHGITGGGK